MNRSDLKDAWRGLADGNSFLLACHERPDGDCLGAALALARALRGLGKDATVLSQDGVPEHYRFLPGSEAVVANVNAGRPDVGILVDSDLPKRAGDFAKVIMSARVQVCVDHHPSREQFGDIRIVDATVSSTSELVVELFDANDIPIDADMATLLLTGIIFDTGGFRYANASPKTFEVAARLAAAGASPSAIAREVFESRPLKAMKVLGVALDSLEMECDGRIVCGQISRAEFEKLDAGDADTEGVVNSIAAVKGPTVAILLREVGTRTVRVSLRSRDGFDVNRVARAFDGGGHAAAAGCTVNGSLDEARSRVICEVRRWMDFH